MTWLCPFCGGSWWHDPSCALMGMRAVDLLDRMQRGWMLRQHVIFDNDYGRLTETVRLVPA